MNVKIDDNGAKEIASRSRGTPRIANRLLKRVRDYATVLGNLGLDDIDRRILETIILKYAGGPVGIETLSSTIGEEVETLEDVYEPYLMQIGFLARTPRGRTATILAYEHLGIEKNN